MMKRRLVPSVALVVCLATGGAAASPHASAPGHADDNRTDRACVPSAATRPAPAPPGFVHRRATVDGVRMHYVAGGHGTETLVLLHGWPQTWYAWAGVMRALARHHRVIAVDLPGLGDSQGTPESYDKRTLAGYVERLVVDELGHRRVHLVGHDFGAGVAFAYAAFHRESAASVTMLDYPLPGPGTDQQQLRAQLWWFGFHAVDNLPERVVAGDQLTYLRWFYETLVAPGNRIAPTAVAEYVRTYCRREALRGGFELYRTIPTDEADNNAVTQRPLAVPILLVGPARTSDPIAEKRALRRTVAPLTEGPVTVRLAQHTGHFVPEENPGFVAEQLRRFLR